MLHHLINHLHNTMVYHNETWRTGCTDCFSDVPNCCEALCCCTCAATYQYGVIQNIDRHVENQFDWIVCLAITCFQSYCIPAVWFVTYKTRGKIQNTYHDPQTNNMCTDLCLTCCCTTCTSAQNYRELTLRGHWPGSLIANKPPGYYTTALGPMH